MLDVLFWGPKASPVTWTSFLEARKNWYFWKKWILFSCKNSQFLVIKHYSRFGSVNLKWWIRIRILIETYADKQPTFLFKNYSVILTTRSGFSRKMNACPCGFESATLVCLLIWRNLTMCWTLLWTISQEVWIQGHILSAFFGYVSLRK
jgi:hypothetical protein